jgi:hypothetical protein
MNQTVTISVDDVIAYETLVSQKLLCARGTISERQAKCRQGVVPPPYVMPKTAYMLPGGFWSSPISVDVYRLIGEGFNMEPAQAVTEAEINEARQYISNLLGVDLQGVRVEVVPSREWDQGDTVEGFQFRVGLTDHLVFVPDAFASPVELLCHELGHAAHTTAQRQNGELPYFFAAPTTAEFVAHVCQYNYLLDHGTRAQFLTAMGQLTTATFALSIMASEILDDFEAFLNTQHAEAITQAVSMDIVKDTYWKFSRDRQHLLNESMRGMAIILALWFVDDHEGVKRFISADRIDQTFDVKLSVAFPDKDFMEAFERVNEQFFTLLDRFNS